MVHQQYFASTDPFVADMTKAEALERLFDLEIVRLNESILFHAADANKLALVLSKNMTHAQKNDLNALDYMPFFPSNCNETVLHFNEMMHLALAQSEWDAPLDCVVLKVVSVSYYGLVACKKYTTSREGRMYHADIADAPNHPT